MGKHSAADSPKWKVGQYVHTVCPTLKFQLNVAEKYPHACALYGDIQSADFRVTTVLPLALATEDQLIAECERLGSQYHGVSALVVFAAELVQERVDCERCGKSLDEESAGSVHDGDTHDDENCGLIFGAPCAHPDCAWQSRSKEG